MSLQIHILKSEHVHSAINIAFYAEECFGVTKVYIVLRYSKINVTIIAGYMCKRFSDGRYKLILSIFESN